MNLFEAYYDQDLQNRLKKTLKTEWVTEPITQQESILLASTAIAIWWSSDRMQVLGTSVLDVAIESEKWICVLYLLWSACLKISESRGFSGGGGTRSASWLSAMLATWLWRASISSPQLSLNLNNSKTQKITFIIICCFHPVLLLPVGLYIFSTLALSASHHSMWPKICWIYAMPMILFLAVFMLSFLKIPISTK